jgi:maltose-binding protein MalE
VFLDNASRAVAVRNSPVQAEIDRIVHDMTDEALLHKKTPRQALEDAANQIQALLDEHWAGR